VRQQTLWPPRLFGEAFAAAQAGGLGLTCHAGEVANYTTLCLLQLLLLRSCLLDSSQPVSRKTRAAIDAPDARRRTTVAQFTWPAFLKASVRRLPTPSLFLGVQTRRTGERRRRGGQSRVCVLRPALLARWPRRQRKVQPQSPLRAQARCARKTPSTRCRTFPPKAQVITEREVCAWWRWDEVHGRGQRALSAADPARSRVSFRCYPFCCG